MILKETILFIIRIICVEGFVIYVLYTHIYMYIHTYGNLSNYICKLNAGNAIAELKGIPVLKINTYFQAALRKTITN